jgi:hypothetical protein
VHHHHDRHFLSCTISLWSCGHNSLPHTPSSIVLLMPNSKHLTHGISNLVSLITKTKLGLSLLLIHKRHTCPKSHKWPRRRTTKDGWRTRPDSHQKRWSTWSTWFDQSMTISSLDHSLPIRMILVTDDRVYYWAKNLPQDLLQY